MATNIGIWQIGSFKIIHISNGKTVHSMMSIIPIQYESSTSTACVLDTEPCLSCLSDDLGQLL